MLKVSVSGVKKSRHIYVGKSAPNFILLERVKDGLLCVKVPTSNGDQTVLYFGEELLTWGNTQHPATKNEQYYAAKQGASVTLTVE